MELTYSHFDYNQDLAQQRALFKDSFPETNGEAIQGNDHYMWKFHSFPGEVRSYEYATYSGNELVAYYAAIPYKYKIGKITTSTGMVCDVMTSSKQRGKGIFTRLGKYSTDELSVHVPFAMGYPIRKEVIPGHLKVGWKIAFKLPLYIKFLRSDSLLKNKKLGFFAPIANVILKFYNGVISKRVNKKYTYSVYSNIEMIEGYESFAIHWSESVENCLIKDNSFVRWRYSAPERNYKFITVRNKERIVGFVAFRSIIKENIPSYGILDYMVLPGFHDCHGTINKILADCAREDHVEAILIMMSKTSARNYDLFKSGFLKSPFIFNLIIKNLRNEIKDEDLFNEKKWHLMWVDSDDL